MNFTPVVDCDQLVELQECEYYWDEGISVSPELVSNDTSPKQQSDFSFNDLHSGLITFENLFGHLQVPLSYPIAVGDERFPSSLWGLNLGLCYEHYNRSLHKELGLCIQPKKNAIDYETLWLALQRYKEIFGHVNVNANFMIQEDSICFPSACSGLRLGELVCSIQSNKTLILPEYHSQFENLGLFLTKCPSFELLYEAVKIYMQTNNKPHPFVIREGSLVYDSALWGCDLGILMQAVVDGRLYSEHRDKWLELKLPMRTRLITDRQKRKKMYDPSEQPPSKKALTMRQKKEQRTAVKTAARPKTLSTEEGGAWSGHGLLSNKPHKSSSSKNPNRKEYRSMQPTRQYYDEESELESIGSNDDNSDDDGNIVDEIEAFPVVDVRRAEKALRAKTSRSSKHDSNHKVSRVKNPRTPKEDLNYETSSAPILEHITTLKQQKEELLREKAALQQMTMSTVDVTMNINNINNSSLVESDNTTKSTAAAQLVNVLAELRTVESILNKAARNLDNLFDKYATVEMLEQKVKEIELKGTLSQHHLIHWRCKLARVQQFGTLQETPQTIQSSIIEAVTAYKREYGTTMPSNYVVPFTSVFPKYTWGMSLGERLAQNAPKDSEPRQKRLGITLGRGKGDERVWVGRVMAILEALLVYCTRHSHGNVSLPYTVSFNIPEYPIVVRGLLLGQWLNGVVTSATKAALEDNETRQTSGTLEQMWLNCWKSGSPTVLGSLSLAAESNSPTASSTMQFTALIKYVQTAISLHLKSDPNGTTTSFVIPECNLYPKECWGLRLGIILTTAINFVSQHDLVAQLQREKQEALNEFLSSCKRITYHFSNLQQEVTNMAVIATDYCSPMMMDNCHSDDSDDDDEPISSQDLELLKQDIYQRRILKFIQNPVDAFSFARKATKIHKRLHTGDRVVPIDFVIPEDDVQYPEEVRGLPLGLLRHWIENKGEVNNLPAIVVGTEKDEKQDDIGDSAEL